MCLLAVSLAPLVSAQDLASSVRDRYNGDLPMTAHFVQYVSSDFLETDERFTGELWLSGSRYRIETGGQTIVSDGETSWIHNLGEQQVLINSVDPDDDGFSLTGFLTEFDSAYEVSVRPDSVLDGVSVHGLLLIPIDPFASFQRVTMWVRSANLDIVRLYVVDLNDVSMEFRLSDTRFLQPGELPGSTFEFRIPDGVDVIDLR